MHGDLLYVTVVYVNVELCCTGVVQGMHHSMAPLPVVRMGNPLHYHP